MDLKQAAVVFKQLDWVIPMFMSAGRVTFIATTLEPTEPKLRLDALKIILPLVYDEYRLASMYVDRYSQTIHIKDFKKQIAESFEAHAANLPHAAVATLLPVIEGVLAKIAAERYDGKVPNWLRVELEQFIAREEASPNRFEERVVVLTSLRDFLRDKLFANTNNYDGLGQLNRHGIVHGLFQNFGSSVNFYRLVSALDSLCFAIALVHGGSGFAPSITDEGMAIAQHWIKCRALSETRPQVS